MTEKKIIKGRILDRVKAAEDSLARQEAKSLEVSLPEGHPLKEEVEKQKAILGGDLSGLPPGHPLLKALQTAKETYDKSQAETVVQETQKSDEPDVEVRKAKRLEEAKVRKERFAREEGESDRKRIAAKDVNKGVDGVLLSVRGLWEKLASNEAILSGDPMNRARIMRMKQVLVAVEKRFSETRLSRF